MNRYAWARRQLDRCHDCGETPRLKARGDLYKVYCPVCLRGHRSQYVSLTAAVKGWNTPEPEWAEHLAVTDIWDDAVIRVLAEEFVSEIDGRDSRQSPEDPGEREEAVL